MASKGLLVISCQVTQKVEAAITRQFANASAIVLYMVLVRFSNSIIILVIQSVH